MAHFDYFVDCTSLEELKSLYKKLCFKYHPDLGGDTETMQIINNQYDEKRKHLGFAYNADESHKKPYDFKNDHFAEMINKIIHFDKMRIEIIGSWIWCFDSKDYHEQLKELGFWYSANKKAWVYSGSPKKRYYKSRHTVNELHEIWGFDEVKTTKLKGLKE